MTKPTPDKPDTGRDDRPIAFVQAGWHRQVVEQGREAFLKEFAARGGAVERVEVFDVPGSYEIPLQSKLLAKTGRYAAIVAAGLVVDGGIYRHEFVARSVVEALMRIQLETEVPIISMVLTPHQFHENGDHIEFFREHFKIKGAEAAEACVETMRNLDSIEN